MILKIKTTIPFKHDDETVETLSKAINQQYLHQDNANVWKEDAAGEWFLADSPAVAKLSSEVREQFEDAHYQLRRGQLFEFELEFNPATGKIESVRNV